MRITVLLLLLALSPSISLAEQRYLVVDDAGADQDKVVDRRGWNWNAAPPDDLPPDWQDGTLGTVGTTHRVEDAPLLNGKPDHKPPGILRNWKIVAGAWVEMSQADKDALQLSDDQDARLEAMCSLKYHRDAAQAIVDDTVTYSQAVRDAMAAHITEMDADLTTHDAEWGNLWTRGVNP